MSKIIFTLHAKDKFEMIQKSGFRVTEEDVLACITSPDTLEKRPNDIKIAQKNFDENHVLRVVFRQENDKIKIITFHPGNRRRYEKKQV